MAYCWKNLKESTTFDIIQNIAGVVDVFIHIYFVLSNSVKIRNKDILSK